MESGSIFIETLWFSYANRIIDLAIKTYSLSDEQAEDLRSKLKRGDFQVKPKESTVYSTSTQLIYMEGHHIEAWGAWWNDWQQAVKQSLRKNESSTKSRLNVFTKKHLTPI